MSKDLSKLRQYYHSIVGQQNIFNESTQHNIDHYPVNILKREIDSLLSDFPNLVPPFNPQEFFSHSHSGRSSYYNCSGIRSYISSVLGRLKIVIGEPKSTPITEKRVFSFINDPNLRGIIERDFA